jgi:hypothetical protein
MFKFRKRRFLELAGDELTLSFVIQIDELLSYGVNVTVYNGQVSTQYTTRKKKNYSVHYSTISNLPFLSDLC